MVASKCLENGTYLGRLISCAIVHFFVLLETSESFWSGAEGQLQQDTAVERGLWTTFEELGCGRAVLD